LIKGSVSAPVVLPTAEVMSASQLNAGEIVTAGDDIVNPEFIDLRLVTNFGVMRFDGDVVIDKSSTSLYYRRLLPGTKITLEVTA